jgi:tetratricopeptide (TPR) repeat protein
MMKKLMFVALSMALAFNAFALNKAVKVLSAEDQADKMFAERNDVTDTAKALENADKCIEAYRQILSAAKTDALIFKYVKAADFKYYNLVQDPEQRKQAYKDMITMLDKFCEGNTLCASSNCVSYCYMTLWGRYGDIIDVMEAATSGIAGKVKENAEKLYASDKTFKDYAASIALGRLHFKAPNILLIMTWPDKNESRKYLEEFVMANHESLIGKLFLADTLWDLGDRVKAAGLYKEVNGTKPRPGEYFEDMRAKELNAARMKEQGIITNKE